MALINNKVKAAALFVGIVWALYSTKRVNQKSDPKKGGTGSKSHGGIDPSDWGQGSTTIRGEGTMHNY